MVFVNMRVSKFAESLLEFTWGGGMMPVILVAGSAFEFTLSKESYIRR